ncbi:spore cortex biosynthesis protein YabQ [Bacillus lacus]|uniref:Spore cortex biosynthesis protein YabQ n=1 Tax=Metabacillus lacus TaxID=1983721 RepID=A0A7X2LXV9_9BACI|nr:spore cortex biosynthesis protein YabQ [Metabacillus lacus]MRX72965.1 spore cortex biosynthesis protein YabQ [Metabacillus lacus]
MTLTTQFYTMLAMIGMGSWLGAALDMYGRFLQRPKRARWFVFLNDIMFWVLQGLAFFYVLLLVNEGELRIYLFLAILCGYAAYRSLIQTLFLKILDFAIRVFVLLYRGVINLGQLVILKPVLGLFQLALAIVTGIAGMLLKLARGLLLFIYSIVKILLLPFKWMMMLLWNFVPGFLKKYILRTLSFCAGFLKRRKNMFVRLWSWTKQFLKK